MARQTILEKSYKIVDGVVRINESVEKELTPGELVNEKRQYIARMDQIIGQMTQLKAQFEEMELACLEVDEMLSTFPPKELVSIPNVPIQKS